jgi:hypothetical protein
LTAKQKREKEKAEAVSVVLVLRHMFLTFYRPLPTVKTSLRPRANVGERRLPMMMRTSRSPRKPERLGL